MQLIEINKARYRRHLNQLIVVCILGLALTSLSISQFLIYLFPDPSGSHFHWNLLGVIIASLIIAYLLNRFRHHSYMTEITYVWNLKQAINRIHRKLPKLKKQAETGNYDAMLAIHYSYAASRLLWQLDDNTITLEQLSLDQTELNSLAQRHNLELKIEDYKEQTLKQF